MIEVIFQYLKQWEAKIHLRHRQRRDTLKIEGGYDAYKNNELTLLESREREEDNYYGV